MTRTIVLAICFMLNGASMGFGQADKSDSQSVDGSGFEGTKAGDKKELGEIPFRWCPSGTFTMGSPKSELGLMRKHMDNEDQVTVTLTKGYWLGEVEVTQGQWQKLMGTTPWKEQSVGVKDGTEFPATFINFEDAIECCKKATIHERNANRLPSNWKIALPTEAQWEYACRAGSKTKFCFGDDEKQLRDYGWYYYTTLDDRSNPEVVGKKKPNLWGIKDMHGNVWEFCNDWYGAKLQGGRDPVGPETGSYRVIRGGCWEYDAVLCRCAHRDYESPTHRLNYNLGFRFAAVPE